MEISVLEIIDKLKSGEITSLELTKKYLAKIKKTDLKIKSFITVCEETALKEARDSDKRRAKGKILSELDGVPIAIKDNILTKGILTTAASKILENFVVPNDATVIKKLKKAGMVILGKTNLDEFAMGSSTENSYFGPTRNPYDESRVSGGTSGGSAAAVRANLAPLAIGSDTGGSIRQPASFCGVVGFKPTYGAVSRYGLIAMTSSLDQIGPISKSVEDIKLLFKIISGYDEMDSTSLKLNSKFKISNFKQISNLKSQKIKIGIPKEYFIKGMEKGTEKIINNTIKLLKKAGHSIQEISLPRTKDALAVYYIIMPAEVTSNLARFDGIRYGFSSHSVIKTRSDGFGAEAKRRIMLGNYVLSAGYYDAYYLKAKKVQRLLSQDFEKAFEKVDFIITPTSPTTAFKIGEKVFNPLKMYLSDIFTVPVNLAGLPALSLPVGLDKGLPVGLQIIGKKFSDYRLLDFAEKVEKIRGDWEEKK